jgi:hypothetical protein
VEGLINHCLFQLSKAPDAARGNRREDTGRN